MAKKVPIRELQDPPGGSGDACWKNEGSYLPVVDDPPPIHRYGSEDLVSDWWLGASVPDIARQAPGMSLSEPQSMGVKQAPRGCDIIGLS